MENIFDFFGSKVLTRLGWEGKRAFFFILAPSLFMHRPAGFKVDIDIVSLDVMNLT